MGRRTIWLLEGAALGEEEVSARKGGKLEKANAELTFATLKIGGKLEEE